VTDDNTPGAPQHQWEWRQAGAIRPDDYVLHGGEYRHVVDVQHPHRAVMFHSVYIRFADGRVIHPRADTPFRTIPATGDPVPPERIP